MLLDITSLLDSYTFKINARIKVIKSLTHVKFTSDKITILFHNTAIS
jgi:hypothetical protein